MPSCLIQQTLLECHGFNTNGNKCINFTERTALLLADPQPSTYTACTDVLASVSELSYFPQLTLLEGSAISSAIIMVWAMGFAWRASKRAM